MKEIVARISDKTYNKLQDVPDIQNLLALKQAISLNPWLGDLLESCQEAVQRNEILKHNKSTSLLFEKKWLEKDCKKYGISLSLYLQGLPNGHPDHELEEKGS